MKATIQLVLLWTLAVPAVFQVQAQVPLLNSFPSASETIYLDFDGQYVTGTSWNWGGPILAQPASLSDEAITEVFNRVAEDYRPFNLNITTDSSIYLAAPHNKRTRVIITTSWQWYGKAGGIAFVGTFKSGDDTPAWVFSDLLGYRSKYIAEACAHEAGHTLGLQHQSVYSDSCIKSSDYNEGQGEGEIGWAPIMGVSYYKNLTTWHTGPTPAGCREIQNDMQTIASTNGLSFRTDDHPDHSDEASQIDIPVLNFLVNGLITHDDDADAFRIQLLNPANISLNAVPQNVGSGNQGANVDLEVVILNSAKDTIGIYNPSDLLNAGIDTNLNSGDYYIIIKPTGNVNHSVYGSQGYYTLHGELAILLPVHQFVLKGSTIGGNRLLSWHFSSDEPVKEVIIEASPDGRKFHAMVSVQPEIRNFSLNPDQVYNYYRLKAATVRDGPPYYSNMISMVAAPGYLPVQVLTNPVRDEIVVSTQGSYSYKIFSSSGKLLLAGKFTSGLNRVDVSNAARGILYLQSGNGRSAYIQVLIKQ